MATTVIEGITTRYEVVGSGAPLLMFSPGGFDATLEKWATQGVYARIKPVEHLSKRSSCILFDRRESGESGGRVERITWAHYVAQAKGLLDHLKIQRAHIMGACMGCCPAAAFGVAHPASTMSLILFWPVGGALYRINTHLRFAEHLAYVQEHGLAGVVSLVSADGKTFNQDPRGGPWASVIHRDPAFAHAYVYQDVEYYKALIIGMMTTLFDRDTAPGAPAEDLLRMEIPTLIVPGRDKSHATSAARYLEECLAHSEYWDVPVANQTEEMTTKRLMEFLDSVA